MPRLSFLLLAAALGWARLAGAQVTKPRSTTTTDRLPKPGGVAAVQQPDGTIAWCGRQWRAR